MQDILAAGNSGLLEQLAFSNVLLAFDFDGTLAPIVDEPDEAAMRPRTRALLARVSARYPCAVISGRAQADVLKRLRGVGVKEIVGNHGLEPWQSPETFIAAVQRWKPVLERRLAHVQGVVIEDKSLSMALHYRRSRNKALARDAIARAAAELGPVRIIGGKQVVNLLPEGAPHKGIALRLARERWTCDTALYIGDDATDEDVFALDEPGRLLSIRVGETADTRAAYFLEEQVDIDRLLERLLELRAERGPARARMRA